MATKTLHDYLHDHLEQLRSLQYSPYTIRGERLMVEAFLRWFYKHYAVATPDRLRRRHLEQWQKSLHAHRTIKGQPLKVTTINQRIRSIGVFLKHLVEQGQLSKTLLDALVVLKQPRRLPGSVLNHAQIKKLLCRIDTTTLAGHRNRAILELIYSSGLRASEALGLDVGDVDLKLRTAMVIGKGNKERVVPIGKTAQRYLESYVVGVRPFLEARSVRILQPDVANCGGITAAKKIAAMAESCYVPVSPHNPNGPIATAMAVHLLAAIPNGYLLEMIGSPEDLELHAKMVVAPLRPENGQIRVPTSPGLGIELQPDVERELPYRPFTAGR